MSEVRKDPLFVVHDGRSGSTYLANLLNAHPEIGVAWESRFVVRMLRRYGTQPVETPEELQSLIRFLNKEPKFEKLQLTAEDIQAALAPLLPVTFPQAARTLLRLAVLRDHPTAKVWGIKKGGSYITQAAELLDHFPRARFIHIVRDGRAVFNSKKRAIHSTRGKPFEVEPKPAARRWKQLVRSFDRFAATHPQAAQTVYYETLIQNPRAELAQICRFLEVDEMPFGSSEASLSESYVPDGFKHLHPNVGGSPKLDRLDAWKQDLRGDEIQTFEDVAGDTLREKGYPLIWRIRGGFDELGNS